MIPTALHLDSEIQSRESLLAQQSRYIMLLERELAGYNETDPSPLERKDHRQKKVPHIVITTGNNPVSAATKRRGTKRKASGTSASSSDDKNKNQQRYWQPEEHERFLVALELYGQKNVKKIADYVGSRTPTQVRTHAQKFYLRMRKEALGETKSKQKSVNPPRKTSMTVPPSAVQEALGFTET